MLQKKYKLTNVQKNIYLTEKIYTNTSLNIIAGMLYINDKFDKEAAVMTVKKMISSNDAFKIKIFEEDNEAYQIFDENINLDIKVEDLSKLTKQEYEIYIENITKKAFVLSDFMYDIRVFKLEENKTGIYVKLHHLISDAWSYANIINQLSAGYEEYTNKEENNSKYISYLEYINSEQEYINSEKYEADEMFWREKLKGIKDPIELSNKINTKEIDASRYKVALNKDLNDKILEYAKINRVSPYTMFMTALYTYIYRVTNERDIVIGSPILNRSNFAEKQIIGMFISTIPIRYKIEDNVKLIDIAKNISKDMISAFRHQKYPLSNMINYVHENKFIKDKMFNIIMSYQNARKSDNVKDIYTSEWLFSKKIQSDLEIHITDIDKTGILSINYDYLNNLFNKTEIEFLHTRIITILENMINDINVTADNTEIMSKEEKNIILNDFNNTFSIYERDKTVIELFEEQVKKTPNKTALIFENDKMTYKELNDKANILAKYILDNYNINTNEKIAIIINKSLENLVAIIAILKCNAVYVPIEVDYPLERIKYMLTDSSSKLILYNKENVAKELENKYKSLDINLEGNIFKENINILENIKLDRDIKNETYIMYTSGTTGKPKGVVINNTNIVRLVKNTNYVKIEENDVILQGGSLAFDATTFEYFMGLLNGLTVSIMSKNELLDINLFKKHILKNKVNIVFLTTQLFNKIVMQDVDIFNNFKELLVGGEVLSIKYMNLVLENSKNLILKNIYGPTENTTFTTFYEIKEKITNNIPIGIPINNSTCYIIDSQNRLLPLGIKGELATGGDGVSTGYLNKPEITKEKFINTDFSKDKIYKTGDICLINFDNNIEYCGRSDNQVKIRGYRIEIDEIEKAIWKYDNISQLKVLIEMEEENKILSAYYVTKNNVEIDKEDLKTYLKSQIPIYMIPKHFVRINDVLPLNQNGKTDSKILFEYRKTLKSEEIIDIKYEGIYLEIYNIFKDILKIDDIKIDDSFFDIGGDSLLAVELVTKAMSHDIIITYADLYKYQTIGSLGDMITKNLEKHSISEPIKYFDYTDIDKLLENNKYDKKLENKEKLGNILVTGATGFLGAHIVDEYLKNEQGKVYCIVRKIKDKTGKERLKNSLKFFFKDRYDSYFDSRIIVIEGDITDEIIIPKEYIEDIDTIINSAAHVKHFGNNEFFDKINVNAVRLLTNFAIENKKKFIQVSTLSVSGNILETGQIQQDDIEPDSIYNENNLYIGQNLDNIYAYTKYLGEKVVLDAIIEKNLDGKIMRMGNLTGRFEDGKFQPNVEENAFAGRLKTIIDLNVLPKNILEFYLEFTPIDYAAKAIINLSKTNKKYNVFHLFNHKHSYMDFVDKVFNEIGINLKHITKDEMTLLIDKLTKEEKGYEKVKGIILDINKNKELDYKPNTIVKSDFTIEVLKTLDFEWPDITNEYIKKYILYLFDIGFLKKGE